MFYGKPRHLDYWTKHCLPVFIILHNPITSVTLWQKVERWKAEITKTGWSITVPATNVLSRDSKKFFARGIGDDPESMRRFYFATDLNLMTKYRYKEIFFRIEVWVNKTLNIREILVFYDDPQKDEPDETINVWAVQGNIPDIMQKFFPWLEYDEQDVAEIAGEIESHLLRVDLSKYAQRYLELEEFFKHGANQLPPSYILSQAWLRLGEAIREAVYIPPPRSGNRRSPRFSLDNYLTLANVQGLLTNDETRAVRRLREMSNLAARSLDPGITANDALHYQDIADALIQKIKRSAG